MERTPLVVHCGDCKHAWTACWLPMDAMKVARLANGLCCPSCGSTSKRIFMGDGKVFKEAR